MTISLAWSFRATASGHSLSLHPGFPSTPYKTLFLESDVHGPTPNLLAHIFLLHYGPNSSNICKLYTLSLSSFIGLWVTAIEPPCITSPEWCVISEAPQSHTRSFTPHMQSPSTVILEPKKIECVITVSIFSWSICYEVLGLDSMTLVFFNIEFQARFFHFPFTPSSRSSLVTLCFLPLEWYHLYIWNYWYFSQASWFHLLSYPAWHFKWYTLHRI